MNATQKAQAKQALPMIFFTRLPASLLRPLRSTDLLLSTDLLHFEPAAQLYPCEALFVNLQDNHDPHAKHSINKPSLSLKIRSPHAVVFAVCAEIRTSPLAVTTVQVFIMTPRYS